MWLGLLNIEFCGEVICFEFSLGFQLDLCIWVVVNCGRFLSLVLLGIALLHDSLLVLCLVSLSCFLSRFVKRLLLMLVCFWEGGFLRYLSFLCCFEELRVR